MHSLVFIPKVPRIDYFVLNIEFGSAIGDALEPKSYPPSLVAIHRIDTSVRIPQDFHRGAGAFQSQLHIFEVDTTGVQHTHDAETRSLASVVAHLQAYFQKFYSGVSEVEVFPEKAVSHLVDGFSLAD